MKIFNWVHRRFKDGSGAQNAKKNGVVADEGTNAKFLLENNAFDDVFGCWKGGILAIGTFGYDPLTKDGAIEIMNGDDEEELVNHHQEFQSAVNESYHITDSEEEENEVEQEEHEDEDDEDEEDEEDKDVNPLVYAVYDAHDYEALLEYDNYSVNPEGIKMNGNHGLEFDAAVVMNMMKESERKKERITLADLFSADSEVDELGQKKKKSKNKLGELIKEKPNPTTKHGLSLAKKLDSTRPIHKLHRLMRKMLKRKIHPELGVTNKEINGDDEMTNYSKGVGEKFETIESVPLLQITRDGNDG